MTRSLPRSTTALSTAPRPPLRSPSAPHGAPQLTRAFAIRLPSGTATTDREAARGGWFIKQKVGDSFFRLTGQVHRLNRVIAKRGNRYLEHIEDRETGEVVHHCEEPLSEHRGHGSARSGVWPTTASSFRAMVRAPTSSVRRS
jgi:hypothetical protein